jgi:putative proteasome-type protease
MGLTAALLSMDSTLRSNLSVGMPLDLAVVRADGFAFNQLRRIEENDLNYKALSDAWSIALRGAFDEMMTIQV